MESETPKSPTEAKQDEGDSKGKKPEGIPPGTLIGLKRQQALELLNSVALKTGKPVMEMVCGHVKTNLHVRFLILPNGAIGCIDCVMRDLNAKYPK